MGDQRLCWVLMQVQMQVYYAKTKVWLVGWLAAMASFDELHNKEAGRDIKYTESEAIHAPVRMHCTCIFGRTSSEEIRVLSCNPTLIVYVRSTPDTYYLPACLFKVKKIEIQ